MQDLLTVMRRLRGPGGCPWDQEQTHESLRPYLLEEAAEAADAVADGPQALADELGDVLLQVAFHSVIAEGEGTFSYAEVERGIVDKLIRRHPHVFGEMEVGSSAEVVSNWQAIKAAERGGNPRSAAERVPAALGALAREAKAQKLAGTPKTGRGELEAALQAAPESAEGVADVLAAVVAWAHGLGVDPEIALRERTARTLAALPAEAL
ncbi:XTP/dITP diphosphohydrolase [Deinococcus reticulitermitis]|uniref:XTP/dITP diphosphohydrolase n=1 Tax=Deinococcus reticulitermitis TaxID=856736 RepID=A0A1H6S8A5_9DEIO|nr:MazG family protein [Deinococcus reticulitermitis]SEI60997.1 XTP/dITP diphosphohydrolase [Deinococcus reticulitermitis]